jgi:hypothetical protein
MFESISRGHEKRPASADLSTWLGIKNDHRTLIEVNNLQLVESDNDHEIEVETA